MTKCMSNKNAVLIGTAVGVIVDLLVQVIIPGSSIIEIIIAFITGIASGIAISSNIVGKCRQYKTV
jgi:hypothetical protein